jgi:tetratricopeptide (TPR) repeat protein
MSPSLDSLEQRLNNSGVDAAVDHLSLLDKAEIDTHLDALVELAGLRALSDPALARIALDACAELGPRYERHDLVPRADYIRARILLNSGRAEDALVLIERARQGWLTIDRALEAYRTDLGRMNVLDDLGRHDEAVRVGERLLAEIDHLDEVQEPAVRELICWLRAAAQENLGAAYGYTGRHQRAMSAYDGARDQYADVGGPDDVARCQANRGVELVAMGFALAGHGDVREASEAFFELGDRHSYAKCLGHLADAELLLGWFTDCLDHITEARALLAELEATTESIRLAVKACRAYLSLNLLDEAIDVGREAEELLTELGLRHDLAEVRLLLAVALHASGEPDRALETSHEAIAGALASDDAPLRIRALVTRSQILAEQECWDDARCSAYEAVEAARHGTWPSEEWAARLQLSRLLDGAESEEHLAVATRLAEELDLPYLRYGVLLERGRRSRSAGEWGEARRLFQQAVQVVEDLRSNISSASVRTSFLEGRTAGHDELLTTLLLTDSPQDRARAFELVERSRARTLGDMVAGRLLPRPGDIGGTNPAISELQADLDACYRALLSGGNEMDRERRRLVQDRATELETLLQRTRLEVGSESETLPAASATSAVSTVVPTPTGDEQVVEYHAANDRLVAFVWTAGRLRVVSNFPTLADTARLVDAWVRHCERYQLALTLPGGVSEQVTAAADGTLGRLWANIFAPVAEHLTPDRELLVVPHGPLHAVPFHALPGPECRVGETWTVSLAPSYTVASMLHSGGSSAARSLVVGVPDEAAPAVAGEARAVASMLPDAELLLDDTATLDRLRVAARQPRAVVHLACHGLHRSRNPMFSALKLSDGWLTAHDVMSMDFTDSLVVLSACESGRHNSDRVLAEPLGLARSFLAVGARAVVVSLWRTDDSVAAEVMSEFYHHYGLGLAPAAALQRAQAAVRIRHPHPAAWAPFTVHGGLLRKGTS